MSEAQATGLGKVAISRRGTPSDDSVGLLALLIAVSSLGLAATSIYTPSIPAISLALDTSVGSVQQTITAYLAAYGAGMLLIGPLSDRVGRRHLLIGGTALFTAASVLATVANDIGVLVTARALQGIGACAGMALARAVARDVYRHEGTARALAAMSVAIGLTPVFAPLAGGYLQVWLGWRANFALLAVLGVVITGAVIWGIPETHSPPQRELPLVRGLIHNVARLLRMPRFLGYALVVTGSSGMFYAFVTAGPVLLIDHFGLTPDAFGRDTLIGTASATLAAFVSARTVGSLGIDRLITIGVLLLLIAAVLMALLHSIARPIAVIGPLCLMGTGMGLSMPNANAGGLGVVADLAGTAAGLSGFMQMIGCGLATLAMAAVENTSALPLGLCWIAAAMLAGAGVLLASPGRFPRHTEMG